MTALKGCFLLHSLEKVSSLPPKSESHSQPEYINLFRLWGGDYRPVQKTPFMWQTQGAQRKLRWRNFSFNAMSWPNINFEISPMIPFRFQHLRMWCGITNQRQLSWDSTSYQKRNDTEIQLKKHPFYCYKAQLQFVGWLKQHLKRTGFRGPPGSQVEKGRVLASWQVVRKVTMHVHG